jgi:hypothetical protein
MGLRSKLHWHSKLLLRARGRGSSEPQRRTAALTFVAHSRLPLSILLPTLQRAGASDRTGQGSRKKPHEASRTMVCICRISAISPKSKPTEQHTYHTTTVLRPTKLDASSLPRDRCL